MSLMKKSRQDPQLKAEIAKRVAELVERSGLGGPTISFRADWSRTRINGFTSGERTPEIQAMLELDKVLEPYLGPYASFYIIYGKDITELIEGYKAPEIDRALINKALTNCLNDYIDIGRIKIEPKLTTSKILDDFNVDYLEREIKKGAGAPSKN